MSKNNCFKSKAMQVLFVCLLLMAPVGTWAQSIELKGTVLDAANETVIGASVIEKGTMNGVVTDYDGNFIITVSENATIVISYVGYLTQEIAVDGRQTLQVTLKEDIAMLDEVVVVGYGTMKKSDISGSITSVSGDKLARIPTANAEAALQGMAPGLTVNFGSGAAGSTPVLQVRGVTTWGTDNSPLVIIDGVPGDMSYLKIGRAHV